ncbi:MAG: FAD-dependent thymidylate synthase [archaeon]
MGDEDTTKRDISLGAEQELGTKYPILDKGFVMLVDYMGNDHTIANSARVSYGKVTVDKEKDRELIRYLMRNKHTTPFEMVEFKFHVKLPIFVARQWIRHRTANVNEKSGRYSKIKDEFYIPDPERVRLQSKANKQGSGEEVSSEIRQEVVDILENCATYSFRGYKEILKTGIAKELARIDLPLSTYTEWYWKIDLHNLFHFLGLRMESHAQEEITKYSNQMGVIVKNSVPIAWEAFKDYRIDSFSLSRLEQMAMQDIILGMNPQEAAKRYLETRYEETEFLEKMEELRGRKK